MRERITFIHKPRDAIDPDSLRVTSNSLGISRLKAAREDRITLGFDELPEEVQLVLKESHELHLRYISPLPYETISPFVSTLATGLHVYYSPRRSTNSKSELLCPLIHTLFYLKDAALCQTPEKSFTSLPSQRFQQSTDYEYYLPPNQASQRALVRYIRRASHRYPSYLYRIEQLLNARSIDIDFDTISQTLTISAFWEYQRWDVDILNEVANNRVEVGILSNEKPLELEELSLAGFLTVIGEDEKPAPTMFSFPARHHPHISSFSAKFVKPTGLHPNLQLEISDSNHPSNQTTCSLHAYLSLPRVIFADRYQLSDPLFMASKNLSSVRYITTPVDLEAPEYAMALWGSSLLLELSPPAPSSGSWYAEVPLHLRYLAPTDTGFSEALVPWPVIFWACTADEGSKFTINPFDRVNLGYDGLFGPRTMFYHLTPEGKAHKAGAAMGLNMTERYNLIEVPVLDNSYSDWIESGTAAVILLGFAWVMWKLWLVWVKTGYGNHVTVAKKKQ